MAIMMIRQQSSSPMPLESPPLICLEPGGVGQPVISNKSNNNNNNNTAVPTTTPATTTTTTYTNRIRHHQQQKQQIQHNIQPNLSITSIISNNKKSFLDTQHGKQIVVGVGCNSTNNDMKVGTNNNNNNTSNSLTSKHHQQKQQHDTTPMGYIESLFLSSSGGTKLLQQIRNKSCIQQQSNSRNNQPNPEQIEAYTVEIVQAIRNSDVPKLRIIGSAKNTSTNNCFNACNRYGESLIHMACRRGDVAVVKFLIEEGNVTLTNCDDYGRLPIHDACWTATPNVQVMDLLLCNISPELFVTPDVRGHTPFHYARKEHYNQWIQYLTERKEILLQRISFVASCISCNETTAAAKVVG